MNRTVRSAGLVVAVGLSLVLVGAALGWVGPDSVVAGDVRAAALGGKASGTPATQVATTPTKPPKGSLTRTEGIRELRGSTKNPSALTVTANGSVQTVAAAPGRTLASSKSAFVVRYAAALGAGDGSSFAAGAVAALPGGDRVTRYQQVIGGVPVLGGEIMVTTDAQGAVRAATAATSWMTPAGVRAKVTAGAARAAAIAEAARKFGFDPASVTSADAKLWLYQPSLAGGDGAEALRPTYRVTLAGPGGESLADVLVDALDSSVRLLASARETARDRIVCDLANAKVDLNYAKNYACTPTSTLGLKSTTRSEGESPSTVADVNTAYDIMGDVYAYYRNHFHLDSYDNKGARIRVTVRACDISDYCPFANAFWDGADQFVFGAGWVTDDTAAHEFTHAVTQHSSDLYYWSEAGAINESISDIFGEFFDQTTAYPGEVNAPWLLGEEISGWGPLRSMSNPQAYGDPSTYHGTYWNYDYVREDNGGVHTNSGVGNYLAYLTATDFGNARAEQLWFRAARQLASGANYQQLGDTLVSACRQMISTRFFTPADCDTVAARTAQVGITPGATSTADYCPHPGEPPVNLFFDDMEKGASQWKFSNSTYWQMIPSSDIPYSYAYHGHGSINGWSPVSGSTGPGQGTTAEMATAVALPADPSKAPSVYFYQGYAGFAGRVDVQVQANSGAWETLPFVGVDPYMSYAAYKASLSAYAGKSVKIRFRQTVTAGDSVLDWYVDDFRIYYCDNVSAAPGDRYVSQDASGMHLGWKAPAFVALANGSVQPYHYELTYTPQIAGAPTTLPSSATTLDLPNGTLPSAQTITLRVRTDDGSLGEAATFTVVPMRQVCHLRLAWPQGGLPVPGTSCVAINLPSKPHE